MSIKYVEYVFIYLAKTFARCIYLFVLSCAILKFKCIQVISILLRYQKHDCKYVCVNANPDEGQCWIWVKGSIRHRCKISTVFQGNAPQIHKMSEVKKKQDLMPRLPSSTLNFLLCLSYNNLFMSAQPTWSNLNCMVHYCCSKDHSFLIV